MHLLKNIKVADHPIMVTLPDGTKAFSTHTAILNLPQLSIQARMAHVFPSFTASLISTGVLCDAGYTTTYDRNNVFVKDSDGKVLLSGKRDDETGMWNYNTPADFNNSGNQNIAFAATMYPSNIINTKVKLASWYHACMGSPAIPTFVQAVDREWIELPGLTAKMARRVTPTVATHLGHLNQKRQHLDSTTISYDNVIEYSTTDSTKENHDAKINKANNSETIITASDIIIDFSPITDASLHADLTGKFTTTSQGGHDYQLVMYNPDTNFIKVIPQRSRSHTDYINSYDNAMEFWKSHGIEPNFLLIDNESSKELVEFLTLKNIEVKMCPPKMHRTLKAERAIRTWKNHLLASLATADNDFPLYLWNLIVPQVETTLNLMRQSTASQHISAWQAVHKSPYDFKSNPFAPIGIKIIAHDKPKRPPFAYHGQIAYYIGPSLQHYRCHIVWIIQTRNIRITDTIGYIHNEKILPQQQEIEDFLFSSLHQINSFITTPLQHPSITDESIPLLTKARQNLQEIDAIIRKIPEDNEQMDEEELVNQDVENFLNEMVLPISEGDSDEDQPAASEGVGMDTISNNTAPATEQRALLPIYIGTKSNLNPPTTEKRNRKQNQKYALLTTKYINEGSTSIELPAQEQLQQIADQLHIAGTPISNHRAGSVIAADAFAMDENNQPLTFKTAIRGTDKIHWEKAAVKELRKLLYPLPKLPTPTMRFIKWADKPTDRTASYYNPQVKVKTVNDKIDRRVRGTYGGNVTDFTGNRTSNTADPQTVNLLLNAAVSEKAHLVIMDIKDFFLGSPLEKPEFMILTKSQLPQEIIEEFKMQIDWNEDNNALVQIEYSLYGLPHAGRISAIKVDNLLKRHGYHQCYSTPCLYHNKHNGIYFTLIVDDYLIKYKHKQDAEHLLNALQTEYEVSVDWGGTRYLGMKMDRNIDAGYMDLSMPGYVQAALTRFNVPLPTKPTISPAKYSQRNFQTPDYEILDDQSPQLPPKDANFILQVIGVFLWYARMVDHVILTHLNKLASRQSNPTENLLIEVHHFLQYMATFPDTNLRISQSSMRYICSSDGSYLSESKSRSRAAGIHFLSSEGDPTSAPINAGVTVISIIIGAVVSSAMECEYAAMYINAQVACGIRNTLQDLGYPQGPTPIITDNTAAAGVATKTAKPKRSKHIAMRYHWLRDRVAQEEFTIVWAPGATNDADFFSKTHPAIDFLIRRDRYIITTTSRWTEQLNQKKRQHLNKAKAKKSMC
jgi:hypothetical protein